MVYLYNRISWVVKRITGILNNMDEAQIIKFTESI